MKRILAFVISVAMILGTVPVFAADEDTTAVNVGANVLFATNFGIFASTPADGNAPVNRLELARMFYRILINKNIPDYSDFNISFYDVSEADTEAVRAVCALGIMNGIGNGMFGSENEVTYAQAVKALVCFLGYKVKAEALGGWPTGYWATAIDLDMLFNAPADINAKITYNGLADLFRYAGEAPIMETYGNETHRVDKNVTYLTHYYNIVRNSAIITANSITNFDGAPLSYGQIGVGSTIMNVNANTVSAADFVGYNVELFCRKTNGKYEVVHYELGDNNVTTLDSADILSADYDEYVYETDALKEKKVKLDSKVTVVYNNTVAPSYDLTTLNPFASAPYDGTVKCVDNTGDNKADVVFVDCYETMVVGSVKDGLISSKVRFGTSIDINNFEENSVNVLNVAGQPIHPDEIAADDILTYYRDLNGNVTKIYVTTESSSGKIDYLTREGNFIKEISLGGIVYKCSGGVNLNPDNANLVPGMFVSVYFDRYGKISDMEPAVFDNELGLIVDYKKDTGMEASHAVKIFGADSRFKTFTLAKKIKVNGTDVVTADNFRSLFGTNATSGKIERQVIKYSANENGELNAVYIANPALDSNGDYVGDFFIYEGFDGTGTHNYSDTFNGFDLRLYPGGTCKTFVVPQEDMRDSERAYRVGYSFSDGNISGSLTAYGDNPNSASPVAFLYITSADTSTALGKTYNIFAVNRVSQHLDENGDEVIELLGWYRSGASAGKVDAIGIADIEELKTSLGGSLPEAGDVIVYGKNAEGNIEKAAFVFDKSDERLCGMFAGNPNLAYRNHTTELNSRFVYGDVTYYDGKYITIEVISDSGAVTKESYPASRFSSGCATFEKKSAKEDGQFKEAVLTDVYDRNSYGSNCTKALVFTSGKYWICGILFND